MKDRRVNDPNIWSFSIYHGDISTFSEFMTTEEAISALERMEIKHLRTNSIINYDNLRFYEYFPLINQRVHML